MATALPFRNGKEAMYAVNPIKNIGEYLNLTRLIQEEWDENLLYYRGVDQLTHRLVPGAYRNGWNYDADAADDMSSDFITRGKAMTSSRYSPWEWYVVMQHHGLPTRLLDWTERSLIALYFALKSFEPGLKPAVWVLNPFWLNQEVTGEGSLFYVDDDLRDSKDEFLDKYVVEDDLPELPIAILPPYVNPRIAVQRSAFTVHGRSINGIHEVYRRENGGDIARLSIAPSAVPILRRELIGAGVSESTVFPDLDGLARELRHDYIS